MEMTEGGRGIGEVEELGREDWGRKRNCGGR